MHLAVNARQQPVLEALLAAGIPIDTRDESGRTALHEAVQQGELHSRNGCWRRADADASDYQGMAPLHLAAGHGDAARPLIRPPHGLALLPADGTGSFTQCAFDLTSLNASPSVGSAAPRSTASGIRFPR